MLYSNYILPVLADIQIAKGLHFESALPAVIVIPVVIALLVMIWYLYSAQRQIASATIVRWLTGLRISLMVLLGLLLLRPIYTVGHEDKVNETLWVLLDESLSMNQNDPQGSEVEHLRWADALGMLPADARPEKLDLASARLSALHDDLLQLQVINHAGDEGKDISKLTEQFLDSIKGWGANFSEVVGRLEKDPMLKSGDAATITRDLRASADEYSAGLDKAAQEKTPTEAAAVIPWSKTAEAIKNALIKLNPLADQADAEFLNPKGTDAGPHADAAVRDAITKVAQLRRADIAYRALTGKAPNLPKAMGDVLQTQNTRIVTFSGSQQIVGTASKAEIAKAIEKGVNPVGTSTNLASALKFVGDQISQNDRASILIVSDGRSNEGGDPGVAAQQLAARGVRVFTLGAGSQQIAVDASVDSIDAPDWVYKNDMMKVSALIRLDGLANQAVSVDFYRGTTLVEGRVLPPAAGDHVTVVESFKDKAPDAGVYEYSIRVKEMPNEAVKENNVQNFRVIVKDDKLRVILVQNQPRWEDRYVANYLRRDHQVQIQQVLLEPAQIANVTPPEPIKASPTNKMDTAQTLPATAEEWAAFDLIILGDVPPEKLTPEVQKNLASAVRDRGTALMVIAGQLNMPARFTGSQLEELLPVHLASNWSAASMNDHVRHGFRPTIAPEGMEGVFSQLDLDEKKNADYWESMESEDNRWYWHSEQTQAKQSASVLWQIGDLHPGKVADTDVLGTARQRALLSTMSVGLGRVLYLASEETWRMRRVDLPNDRSGANLHERFWGQVMRWVVQNDMPAGGKYARFGAKTKTLAGTPVVVSVRLLKEDFTPRKGEKFKVVAKAVTKKDATAGTVEGGEVVATADAIEAPESPGVYRATFTNLKPGGVEISLAGPTVERLLADDPAAKQKTLLVDVLSGTDAELRNVNADFEALGRIAQAGNGVASHIIYASALGERIPDRIETEQNYMQVGLFADSKSPGTIWAHRIFLILFIVIITAEWIVRKAGGLV